METSLAAWQGWPARRHLVAMVAGLQTDDGLWWRSLQKLRECLGWVLEVKDAKSYTLKTHRAGGASLLATFS